MKKFFKFLLIVMVVIAVVCVFDMYFNGSRLRNALNLGGDTSSDPSQGNSVITNDGSLHFHEYGAWDVIQQANCKQNGTEERYCDCGAKQSRTISATGHTEITIAAQPATCTEAGLTEGQYCSICNETLVAQQTIPAHHTEFTPPAVAATCTKDGKTAGKACSVCKQVLVEPQSISAHHTEVITPATAATCSTDGNTEGKHCSACERVLVESQIIPALMHIDENGTCSRCQQKIPYSSGLVYISNGDGTCYVSGVGTCTDKTIYLSRISPSGDVVTGIGNQAFYNHDILLHIQIPNSKHYFTGHQHGYWHRCLL